MGPMIVAWLLTAPAEAAEAAEGRYLTCYLHIDDDVELAVALTDRVGF